MHGKRNRALGPTIDSVTDEGRSTDQTRILPQAGAYDRHIVDQEIECLRDAAAHDDPSRGEKMDQAGKPRAEISGLFAEQRESYRLGARLPQCGGPRSFAMRTRCRASLRGASLPPGGRGVQRSSRGESFEASDRPARANWPLERHAKMPDMARHATTAVQQPTIDHNPATHASVDSHIDEMSQAATSAIESETLLKVSSHAYQPYNFGLWPTRGKNLDPWLTAKSRKALAAGESALSVRLTTCQRRRIGRFLTSRHTSLPSATSAAMV